LALSGPCPALQWRVHLFQNLPPYCP
jgi:hypothetical protein